MAELADAYGSACAMIVNSKSVLFETDFYYMKRTAAHIKGCANIEVF